MGTLQDWQRVADARGRLDDALTLAKARQIRDESGDEDAFMEELESPIGQIGQLEAAWREALELAMR